MFQQLLTEVSLEADSYLEVENFIDEIERMERIFIVDSINFIAPEETQEQSEADESMQMTVAFSAFYRPDLVDLQHEAPRPMHRHRGKTILRHTIMELKWVI